MTYLVFTPRETKAKAQVIEIRTHKGTYLGIIAWHNAWRKYVLEPESDTLWDAGCLQEAIQYLDMLMNKRKEEKNATTRKTKNSHMD